MFTTSMDPNQTRSHKLEKVENKNVENFPSAMFPWLWIWYKAVINLKEIKSLNIFKGTYFFENIKNFIASTQTVFM